MDQVYITMTLVIAGIMVFMLTLNILMALKALIIMTISDISSMLDRKPKQEGETS